MDLQKPEEERVRHWRIFVGFEKPLIVSPRVYSRPERKAMGAVWFGVCFRRNGRVMLDASRVRVGAKSLSPALDDGTDMGESRTGEGMPNGLLARRMAMKIEITLDVAFRPKVCGIAQSKLS
jgi:hypothetical protein